MSAGHPFTVLATPDDVARASADLIVTTAAACQGRVSICLAGGSTPRALYDLLSKAPHRERMPWHRCRVYWGDERFVPSDDPRNNYRMACETLLGQVDIPPAQIHPIPTDGASPAESAAAYAALLQRHYGASELVPERPLFDVTLLGVGEDGHTASLFPGTAALDERETWVTPVAEARPARITLTYPALESSREVLMIATGTAKRPVLSRIARGDNLPAARLKPTGRLHWLIDRMADPS